MLNHYRATFQSHPFTSIWVTRETTDPVGKLRVIPWREQKARSTILDEFWNSADRAANHRELTCQAFEDHQAGGFGPDRGTYEAVGSLHIRGHIDLVAEETDPGLQTQCLGKLSEVPRLRAIPNDPGNDLRGKSAQGPKQDVDSLPADELSDHEGHKLVSNIEFLPEMRSCDVVRPKTFRIDEMGTAAEVWPYAFSFKAPQDKITDAENFAVAPE